MSEILKIGLFADVHANPPALKALCDEFARRGTDELWCAGDLVGIGPWPNECVHAIASLENLTVVRGNHERYHLTKAHTRPDFQIAGRSPMPDEILHHAWRFEQIDSEAHAFLEKLPYAVSLERLGYRFSIVHYAPNSEGAASIASGGDTMRSGYARFPATPDAPTLDALFREGGIEADFVLYGHEHNPSLTVSHGTMYAAPGSCGCARTGKGKKRGGTRGAILSISKHGLSYEPFEVPYDVDAVWRAMQDIPDGARLGDRFFG